MDALNEIKLKVQSIRSSVKRLKKEHAPLDAESTQKKKAFSDDMDQKKKTFCDQMDQKKKAFCYEMDQKKKAFRDDVDKKVDAEKLGLFQAEFGVEYKLDDLLQFLNGLDDNTGGLESDDKKSRTKIKSPDLTVTLRSPKRTRTKRKSPDETTKFRTPNPKRKKKRTSLKEAISVSQKVKSTVRRVKDFFLGSKNETPVRPISDNWKPALDLKLSDEDDRDILLEMFNLGADTIKEKKDERGQPIITKQMIENLIVLGEILHENGPSTIGQVEERWRFRFGNHTNVTNILSRAMKEKLVSRWRGRSPMKHGADPFIYDFMEDA